ARLRAPAALSPAAKRPVVDQYDRATSTYRGDCRSAEGASARPGDNAAALAAARCGMGAQPVRMRPALLLVVAMTVSVAAAQMPQPEPRIAAAASKMDRRTVAHTVTFANGVRSTMDVQIW